jgi:hypothetical protein
MNRTKSLIRLLWLIVALAICSTSFAQVKSTPEITFNTNFEGGSIGRIEKLTPTTFRLHVQGQHDERGRNRQASWFYIRMDHVQGRDLTLTLTDLIGEYDDKPGAVPGGPDILPVFSEDSGQTWHHFPTGTWDDQKKEMTLNLRPAADSVLLAHIAPYTPSDLNRLLADVSRSRNAVIEVIGKTALGHDLHLITISDPEIPDQDKRSLWLQARQHAWEAGTSYIAEGALRFLISEDPAAKEIRRTTIFRCIPLVDVDGALTGKVRFNANGYDVNRHWDQVDLRHPEFLRLMPEIWYTKKAIVNVAAARAGHGIDLLVNLHNTETNEYMETHAQDEKSQSRIRRLFDLLVANTAFSPSTPLAIKSASIGTTNHLCAEYGVPVILMETRIGTSKRLGHRPTVEDRLKFGRDLVIQMAEAVR